MTRNLTIIVLLPLVALAACGDGEGSHNAGQDCLQCHQSGGSGEGAFSVAGTVYDDDDGEGAKAGVTVEIYSAPGGNADDLVATLTTDDSGNFYSSESLDFDNEDLYPVLISGSEREEKGFASPSGACNSCHRTGEQAEPLHVD